MSTIEQTLLRLQQSAFRAKFHLSEKDRQYIILTVIFHGGHAQRQFQRILYFRDSG